MPIVVSPEVFDVIAVCGFTGDTYADDTKVYVSMPSADYTDVMYRLKRCITHIRDWMASNKLKLGVDKTEIIWLGTRQQLDKITMQMPSLPNATVPFSTVVNDLGISPDSRITMTDHTAAVS